MDQALRDKIERVFPGYVVDKRDALQPGLSGMPRFVAEFLIAKARAAKPDRSLAEVREKIERYAVDADRRSAFVSRLMREGEARLIALLEVEPRPERNAHVGHIAQLELGDLAVDDALVASCPELLHGGAWGSCLLGYDPNAPRSPVAVKHFDPYQLTQPDMEAFRAGRKEFTFDEWLDLLITSAGYNPAAFPTLRHKLLVLCRLVPLAQKNVHLLELGPRGTGKSYLLRNLSSRVHLLAGARATPAALLYDLRRRELGIIGRKKALVFDEVGATAFPDLSLVAALKDYMEAGIISRGGRALTGDCSFVFAGNIDLDAEGRRPHPRYCHYLEVLPKPLCDPALADRIHGILPGWELPKISDQVLADGVGFLSDYFGEVLATLRGELLFDDFVATRLQLTDAVQRDQVAIRRITTGLAKMLFPDGRIVPGELDEAARVAVELRQRVHEQLVRMAEGEFRPKAISFPGMRPLEAADLEARAALTPRDVAANQEARVGAITILTVGDRGGGDVGFVECAHVEGGGLGVTGLRGKVLEQSVQAAYDALLHLGPGIGLDPERLRARRMAVHLVDIAETKDGPSAGLAFALAMLSAATGRPVVPGLACTGELSLHGQVGAIGGLPEKLAAALRHGRRLVLIPAENAAELTRVPEVACRLDVRAVHTLAEAVALALGVAEGAGAAAEAEPAAPVGVTVAPAA
jgi:ATP-dependent Lon protease